MHIQYAVVRYTQCIWHFMNKNVNYLSAYLLLYIYIEYMVSCKCEKSMSSLSSEKKIVGSFINSRVSVLEVIKLFFLTILVLHFILDFL